MPIRGLNGSSANWNRRRWPEIEAMRRRVRIREGVAFDGFLRSLTEAAGALVGFERLLAVQDEDMLGCFWKGHFDDLISHPGFPFTTQRARPGIVNAIGHRLSLLSRTNIARKGAGSPRARA